VNIMASLPKELSRGVCDEPLVLRRNSFTDEIHVP